MSIAQRARPADGAVRSSTQAGSESLTETATLRSSGSPTRRPAFLSRTSDGGRVSPTATVALKAVSPTGHPLTINGMTWIARSPSISSVKLTFDSNVQDTNATTNHWSKNTASKR